MNRKVALVTGAGRGIGRSIALALAHNGYDIGVNYCNSEEKAFEVCKLIEESGASAIPVKGDVSDTSNIQCMFDTLLCRYGKIDLLVNNAGITRFVSFLDTTEDLWDKVNNTDWKGAFFCAQQAAKIMIEKQIAGNIINITSNQQDGCWPASSVYGPTKAALNKFTKHAALELSKYGIRVNAIAPGYTGDSEQNAYTKSVAGYIPLGRFAKPDEIASSVVFLASDQAEYITGICLNIDGGTLLPVATENQYKNR